MLVGAPLWPFARIFGGRKSSTALHKAVAEPLTFLLICCDVDNNRCQAGGPYADGEIDSCAWLLWSAAAGTPMISARKPLDGSGQRSLS